MAPEKKKNGNKRTPSGTESPSEKKERSQRYGQGLTVSAPGIFPITGQRRRVVDLEISETGLLA